MLNRDVIVHQTQRALKYEDGKLVQVLEPGRHTIPRPLRLGPFRTPVVRVQYVDMRERDLTIKGQEILTADKVSIRISIIVQFRVVDPRAALEAVEKYEERLYTDVQLAARRSLAAMTLDEILVDRNRLSEDILRDVHQAAQSYGVEIGRADVKDLIFPGNLQTIMNRVLAAERDSEAQLVEARTRAESQRLKAEADAAETRLQAEAQAEADRRAAEGRAEAQRLEAEAEVQALRTREGAADLYAQHPALLRLRELETLHTLAGSANARIYIGFDKHAQPKDDRD